MLVLKPTTSIICCIGTPLNGIVIWLLGFQIKRNPFTVLILNLAVADFGYLVSLALLLFCYLIDPFISIISLILRCLSHIMYVNGLFLLAAISIDRCVCVLFPIWHRCSRPKHLSSIVCVFLWIFSFLFVGILNIMEYVFDYYVILNLHLIVTAVLCLPLITISILILFVQICLKQIKSGRLLVMILITLLCFLILTLPLYIYALVFSFFTNIDWTPFLGVENYFFLGSSLNSTVNPIIYYLVGRNKRAHTPESIKVVFQRVFKEDEAPESRETPTNRASTPV